VTDLTLALLLPLETIRAALKAARKQRSLIDVGLRDARYASEWTAMLLFHKVAYRVLPLCQCWRYYVNSNQG
jgi:hypothetical protein